MACPRCGRWLVRLWSVGVRPVAVRLLRVRGQRFVRVFGQLAGGLVIFRVDRVRPGHHIVEEPGDGGERGRRDGQGLEQPLPDLDERTDPRLVRQPGVDRRLVGVVQHIHHVGAADPRRIIQPGILEAARLEVLDPIAGPVGHVGLGPEHDRAGRAGLHAGRLQPHAHAIGAEGALVRLVVDRVDAGNVERAAFDAVAAADAVLADEVDDAVGVLHDGARRRACLQATRILAMHAAVLADQPLQVALFVFPFGEPHQRPDAGIQVHGIVVGSLEIAHLGPQVVPLHAGRLARLAADAAADVDQLGHFLLVVADGWRRQRGG